MINTRADMICQPELLSGGVYAFFEHNFSVLFSSVRADILPDIAEKAEKHGSADIESRFLCVG